MTESIRDRLRTDLTAAMRAKDELRKTTIRALLAAIKNAEVAGSGGNEVTDTDIERLVQTEIKKRNESAQIYDDAGRPEQATKERDEAAILAGYLPAQLSPEQLAAIAAEEVAKAGDGAQMGVVIKAVRARVGQQASGGDVAAAVKAAITG